MAASIILIADPQYAAKIYRDYLAEHDIKGSMSRQGNPYDNAKAENFMKTLKVEGVYPMAFETVADVVENLTKFIEGRTDGSTRLLRQKTKITLASPGASTDEPRYSTINPETSLSQQSSRTIRRSPLLIALTLIVRLRSQVPFLGKVHDQSS